MTFADVTPDVDLAGRLSAAYGGDIANLDAFTGALVEETAAQTGGIFGDLLFEAWSDQFYRSIAGDRSVVAVVGVFAGSMRTCVT